MANDSKYIFNAKTGEEIIREMTDEEQAERNADVALSAQIKADKEAEDAAKLVAKEAVLAKLGLTPEEAAALLG